MTYRLAYAQVIFTPTELRNEEILKIGDVQDTSFLFVMTGRRLCLLHKSTLQWRDPVCK